MRGILAAPSALVVVLALLAGCKSEPANDGVSGDVAAAAQSEAVAAEGTATRNAYFGDLHIHTQLSFDAFIFGTRSTPDSAYEYAKGGAIEHPSGFEMRLKQPLDFLGVTDHAMYMGMLREMNDPQTKAGQHEIAKGIREAATPAERVSAFQRMFPYLRQQLDHPDDLLDRSVVRSAWATTVAAAERHNAPGEFTTFVAYEYTASGAARENLHRNVVFRGAAPDLPFSSMDSGNPEDLWDWMDRQRGDGVESIAIPHNSNGSDGMMFALAQTDGSAMDAAYAEQRMRNEPIVEVTQVKGTSETHPMLSPNDEWADFELMEVKVATVDPSQPEGSYVRDAYLNGLQMAHNDGINPYRFGLIGSSDTHVGAGSFDEDNYWSKVGIVDGTAEQRGSVPLAEPDADGNPQYVGADTGSIATYDSWGASGLAAVWAEANTRAAIFDAFRRKETFATSGPRMRVRFFAGYGLNDASRGDAAHLYRQGVPMGGDLLPREGSAPEFVVWAARDAESAPLQRVQIVKGWIAHNEAHERVFDVACSDGLAVDPQTHRCPDNGARVNVDDCSITAGPGAAELRTLWRDPSFVPDQRAFYYVRVLENPTCRWSTWDAVRAGVPPRESLKATIQERAWSSPIWYVPPAKS